MPKHPSNPPLFNAVLQISISKLKELGYLNTDQSKLGVITWTINGEDTASISIKVSTYTDQPHIELDYSHRGEPRNYSVGLVTITSNLGKGLIWYFRCPQTYKLCRKLYLVGGYFLHREAFNGCMFETQTHSKYYRELDKVFGIYFRIDDLYSQLYQKNFKKTYAGRPTKRYLRIMKQIHKAEIGGF
tara:strand:+ start:209 stop:769 length:561 start_codon:yes stop_codon:yes gene_type:complete